MTQPRRDRRIFLVSENELYNASFRMFIGDCGMYDLSFESVSNSTWFTDLISTIQEKYGEQYAERIKKHVEYVMNYDGHGAPGHMDLVLINALIYALEVIEG